MPNEEFEPLETDFLETVPEPDDKQLASISREERYLQLLVTALQACANYRPMFGKGRKGGLTLADFQQLYGSDPFYHWIGLDSPRMYAAHKAAGV